MIFAAGTLSIVFNVANSTLFVSIVEPSMYMDGQSLLNGSRAMSYVAGPSAGGLLAQLLSAPIAIIADALSFLGSAFLLARIRPTEPPASGGKDGATAGLRFIARSPIVRASLIGVAVVNLFNMMFSALFTLYAIRTLHVSPGLLGVVLGGGALGGVLGSVLIGLRPALWIAVTGGVLGAVLVPSPLPSYRLPGNPAELLDRTPERLATQLGLVPGLSALWPVGCPRRVRSAAKRARRRAETGPERPT